jgi:uncharacterized protein with HEPN domain
MSEREWRFYINDMLNFAYNVSTYTEGFTQQEFVDTGLNYDATIRNLELIGEAATHIPAEIRETYRTIPWRQVIATRNKLIHNYLGIDNDTLWSIIQDDISALVDELERIVNEQG